MLKGALVAGVVVALTGALAGVTYVRRTGLSARAAPGPVETAIARQVRAWAVPSGYSDRQNPVPRDEASVRGGGAHFADHCASCHANDGSGDTQMGRGTFPPAPDMRGAATQRLSDGELFYVIEHGVRFTAMPAWGTGTPEGEEASWHLVNFIRHLPEITPDEVEGLAGLNPRPPAEVRQEIEMERFLRGEDVSPAPVEGIVPGAEHGAGHE